MLQDVFPNIPLNVLHEAAKHKNAVDILLKKSTTNAYSLAELLNGYVSSIMNESKEIWLNIARNNLWNAVLQFYKTAKHNPDKMKSKLNVEFEGEDGIDAGAIKGTFFELALSEGDQILFEGDIYSRVPKKDAGLEPYFEYFGMLVVHSIVNGGPTLRNVCPSIYQYIITNDMESTAEQLNLKGIPQTLASAEAIALIEKVRNI